MNAPRGFQRFMEDCLYGMRDEICIAYLDDVIVFSKSFEKHLEHTPQVLQRLRSHGLKLKIEKCKLFQKEVNNLGQIVSLHGYRPYPAKVSAVTTLKGSAPKTVGEVRELLGLIGLLGLFDLLQGPSSDKAKTTKKAGKKAGLMPSSKPVLWQEQHRDALAELCDRITSPPIIGYPDYIYPFVLHTNASLDGLSAVLYQKQDGKMRIIRYVSRSLSPAEKTVLECQF